MPTIIDVSDEPKYTIKAVSIQTGILPVTLRAWERRYDLLMPSRGDNRYRLYSERDVAILRWIKSRVDNGVSIRNAAAEFRSLMRAGHWPDTNIAPVDNLIVKSTTPPGEYADRLYQAFIKHDETGISQLLREIFSGYDLVDAFEKILVPALTELGEAWYNGKIRVTTEHFASAYLRGKLLNMFQSLPLYRNRPLIMIGCAPIEEHEIGSLMLAILLRSSGNRVEYLGPDIPLEDLVDYASYEHPQMVILSATLVESALELRKAQEQLNKLRPAVQFGFGGAAFNTSPDLIRRTPGHFLGRTLSESVLSVQDLLSVKSRR